MRRLSLILVLLAAALVAAQPPAPKLTEISTLIKQLGSEEYADREAATKRLDALGPAGLNELRAALRSENPEVVRRARELIRKIEHRLDNEKTLAPTLVTLDAKNERLDDVLAALSKQAKCEVVLDGPQLQELASRWITVSTRGEVPFWEAVLRVCDAADLEVASAGGFTASNVLPLPRSSALPRVRSPRDAGRAVVLGSRGSSPRRPAAVHGAVLVEALPFPKTASPSPHSALLQVWPEPRLAWGLATGARISAAIDAAGERLTPEVVALVPPKARPTSREGLVIVRNADGTAGTLVVSEQLKLGGVVPNTRQAIVGFQSGERQPTVVKELHVALLGTVRSGVEPLARASKLEINQRTHASGAGGAEMTVSYSKKVNGKLIAEVTLTYDSRLVQVARVGEELPGTKGGPEWDSRTVHGVRITDPDGKPYTLGLTSGQGLSGGNGRQVVGLTLELHPDKDGHGPPATATFWGTYAKPVEVPVVLRDVPLSTGK